MDQRAAAVSRTAPRSRRGAVIFAVLGVTLALAAGGLYVYRQQTASPAVGASTAPATPEDAVREFLAAVFLAQDSSRLDGVVCASWDPANALQRTQAEIDKNARVSWDDVRVISQQTGKANVSARLGLRFADDIQPSSFQQWRFSVVDETGWRVCEARPFID